MCADLKIGLKRLGRFLGILAIAVVGFQMALIWQYSRRCAYDTIPFRRENPEADLRILFLGDSTAVGTGASSPLESVAGWFGRDFPQAQIENISQNGKKISGLLQDFHPEDHERYDLVVIQIGANDILRWTSLKKIREGLSEIISRAQRVGNQVVIMHSGNVGAAPLFSWPLSWFYEQRSLDVRKIYLQEARSWGVLYVDLFLVRHQDLFLKDPQRFYAPDYLHPSGAGYRWWYQRLRETLGESFPAPEPVLTN